MAATLSDEPVFLRALLARRSVLIALTVFVVVATVCLLAAWIAPADPARM